MVKTFLKRETSSNRSSHHAIYNIKKEETETWSGKEENLKGEKCTRIILSCRSDLDYLG